MVVGDDMAEISAFRSGKGSGLLTDINVSGDK
jgi:hypothetical protein